MKRLFNPRKRSEGEPVGEQGNTLDRIVKDKEGIRRRLEEEEKEFLSKKREAERKMIEFEKQVEHSLQFPQRLPERFILGNRFSCNQWQSFDFRFASKPT